MKKGCRVLCQAIPIKYAWVRDNRDDYSITILYNFMKVSRSGYYHWLDRLESNRDQKNRELTIMIKDIFIENRNVYGCRRIAKKLEAKGVILSRHRIRRLMSRAGLSCRFKVTTDSKHNKIKLC